MKHMTLLFLLRDGEVLLAMKKRGFGAGRWNGVGGKIEGTETVEEAAVRECSEEIGVTPGSLEKVAQLSFTAADDTPDILAHVFVTREWEGEPVETEEMAPKWFALDAIPYNDMWQDDEFWLPQVLEGKKLIASFVFDDNENIQHDGTKVDIVTEVA